MATIKEHGVLFLAPMVKAILAGRKTQTRRLIPTATGQFWDHAGWRPEMAADGSGIAAWVFADEKIRTWVGTPAPKAPHGPVGRRLWVRETWRTQELPSGLDGIRCQADDAFLPIESTREAADAWVVAHNNGKRGNRWAPSIHMPRWASRITLEVTRVRVERVRDITPADALAEGFADFPRDPPDEDPREVGYQQCVPGALARDRFADLWDSINGAGSFASSPWVWVYDFRRVG